MTAPYRVEIARDDQRYQSFPDVVEAKDGRLVLVFREADAHVARDSHLVLMDSFDYGRTWSNRRYLDAGLSLSADGAVWNCPRIVRQRDGGLTVLCDLSQVPPGITEPVPEDERCFRTFTWRSFDYGRSWSSRRPARIQGLVPDRLLEIDGDTWMVGSHYRSLRHFGTMTQVVTFTRDAGETWSLTAMVAEVPGMQFCEGSVVRLDGSRLVCYLRENSYRGIPTHRCYSNDGGLHWSHPEPCDFVGHRPVAGLLRSGRMLVTFRDVSVVEKGPNTGQPANPGTRAWLGDASGRGQGTCLTIESDGCGNLGDYGYSGWVQLGDGRIFCVYHTRGERPTSYIAGAWFREEDFGKGC